METRVSKVIDKLAWLCIKDKRILLVRSKGNDTFYIPGGKREGDESDHAALIREVKEEVSVDLVPSSINYAHTFRTQAHGKPEGVMVNMTCYFSDFIGEIQPDSEIAEVVWAGDHNTIKCSAVTKMIMDWLTESKLIEPVLTAGKEVKQMKTYQWIIFDADDTLFSFDAFSGLKRMFSSYNVDFTELHYEEYQAKNKSLWKQYQDGAITAEQLQQQRFTFWGERLQVTPKSLNSAFLNAMAEICAPLTGAVDLLNSLKGKVKLGIITNGFTELQRVRLERTGLQHHFEFLVVSEEVKAAKPSPRIFEHALFLMGNPPREQVLMVGDNAESDIQGGLNVGVDTCWVNVNNLPAPAGIVAHYQVSSLDDLRKLLHNQNLVSTDCLIQAAAASSTSAIYTTLSSNSDVQPRQAEDTKAYSQTASHERTSSASASTLGTTLLGSKKLEAHFKLNDEGESPGTTCSQLPGTTRLSSRL